MNRQEWLNLSQNNEGTVVFAVHIRSLIFGICEVPIPHYRFMSFFFPGGREVVFSEILTCLGQTRAHECRNIARWEGAELFWQYQVATSLAENGLCCKSETIKSITDDILKHYQDQNSWLPDILDMEVVHLPPGAVRRSDWCGTRSRILTLSQSEKNKISRKHRE